MRGGSTRRRAAGALDARTLDVVLGHARPIYTSYIWYPRKVAVIWEFNHVVFCRTCSAPDNASIPRGRVVRFSFNRQTHLPGNAIQIPCASTGSSRALCFRR